MSEPILSFRDLRVYQAAFELQQRIFKATGKLKANTGLRLRLPAATSRKRSRTRCSPNARISAVSLAR